MTTPVQNLITRFGDLMNDADSVRWTAAERINWINDGQRELVTFKDDANVKTAVMTLTVGARQSLGNTTDCHKILTVRAGGTNRSVLPCDRSTLDAFSPDWMASANDDPVKHWMPDESPTAVWVYPSRLNAGAQMLVTYVAIPPTVTTSDNLGVRDGYAENILNYMLYRAYSKDAEFSGNGQLAAAAYQLFKA